MGGQGIASATGRDSASIKELSPQQSINGTGPSSSAGASCYTDIEGVQANETSQRATCHCSHCLAQALGCVPIHDVNGPWMATEGLQDFRNPVTSHSTTLGLLPATQQGDGLHACEDIAPGVTTTPTPTPELIRQINFRLEGLESAIYELKADMAALKRTEEPATTIDERRKKVGLSKLKDNAIALCSTVFNFTTSFKRAKRAGKGA